MKTLFNNLQTDIDKMAQDVVQLLIKREISVSTAESCTGGLLSSVITDVSGSSAIFSLGQCVYANEFKISQLSVQKSTLETKGAVSYETALQMAQGARKSSGSDIGISTTGIAGPTGGTHYKPIGTVFFGCVFRENIKLLHLRINTTDIIPEYIRKYIRMESTRQALIILRDMIF